MRVTRRSLLSATALGLLAPRLVLARTDAVVTAGSVDQYRPELDRIAQDILSRSRVPGLSIAAVYKDEVVYLRGFGVRQAGKPEPVDSDTVFQLASMSKPIASTVMAALAGDGLVGWDDPIVRHDAAFAMHDAWVTRQVTLRDMFCHRSGLPDHGGDLLEDIGYDRAEILHRLRHIRPASSFRSQYAYTNFGFTAAAVAAARASGISWENLCAARLYRPLGMTRTSSRFADFLASSNRAVGHVSQNGAWIAKYTRDPDAQSPAGGVSSSARDLALWLRLQLGRGTVDRRDIVKAAALDETHRPQIVSAPARNPAVDHPGFYGLGWGVGYDDQGRVRLNHSGGFNLGAATCVNIVPAESMGVAVLTNAFPVGVPEAICRSFLDIMMDGKVERDWLALFRPILVKTMAPDYGTAIDYSTPLPNRSPSLGSAAYIGGYHNDLFDTVQVVGTDAELVLRLGPKQDRFALRHFERDVFTFQPVGENAFGASAVTFMVGPDRKAMSLTIENLDINGQGTFSRAAG